MDKKVKIYNWYDRPPTKRQKFTQPSLTDGSFFEPLNVLVDKIMHGESTTFIDSTRQMFEFADYDVDMDMDSSDYYPDDLTEIDEIKNRKLEKAFVKSDSTLSNADATKRQASEAGATENENSNRETAPNTATGKTRSEQAGNVAQAT